MLGDARRRGRQLVPRRGRPVRRPQGHHRRGPRARRRAARGAARSSSRAAARSAASARRASRCARRTSSIAGSSRGKDEAAARATVRELLAGNICRCTGYQLIVDAVIAAATRGRVDDRRTFARAISTRRVAARAAHPDWMVLAGGTDLMVNANHRAGARRHHRSLAAAPSSAASRATRRRVTIGAGTTWYEVEHHPAILETLAAARARRARDRRAADPGARHARRQRRQLVAGR